MRFLPLLAGFGLAACSPGGSAATPALEAGDPPATAAAADPRSETRTFRDWIAICDNGDACSAYGQGEDGFGWIRVAMAAGPDARPEVAAGRWPDDGAEAGPLTLTIDMTEYPLTLAKDADAATAAPAQALEVVRALADGATARIGPDQAISLSGAAAAMLWIDERQGRVNTVTALRRPGSQPASSVPEAPALPVVTPARAVAQTGFGGQKPALPAALEAVPAVAACRTETGDHWAANQVMSARLDASTELWAVPCFVGAYNIGHDWYVTGPGGRDPRPARLSSSSGEVTASTINGGYSPETRTLSAFAKGRGIGDCGVASTWTWTGRAFVLTSEQEMSECWGIPAERWPTTWRTR
ncbi:MAG: DUF1176 domain-containing protein [Brevundimonas sp.]|uniref:DUF1176 domain-containing protein n=1 Tax=Brevundimonas sp. TaxID=1871086 RepID=UPI003918AE88